MTTESPATIAAVKVRDAVSQLSGPMELGQVFADAGFELALVGGPVRDIVLGREIHDFDFTTNAKPQEIIDTVSEWADTVWDVGIEFGTVGVRKGDFTAEVTTYRQDVYREETRKPHVTFSESLSDDLVRRDFTINAMAVRLPLKIIFSIGFIF